MSFEGRIALVTGGSRGIGRAIVESLAAAGAKVAFVYHSNQTAADSLVKELKEKGQEAWGIQCDVANKDECDKVVEQVLEKWGKIDILVNNAGIVRDGLLVRMKPEDWADVITTNLSSVYNFCHTVTKAMMGERYGRIINMSSVSSDHANPGQANYAASKGGIEGFSKCLATEVAKRGITVNAIAPGFIATDMTEEVRNSFGSKIKKSIPARRLGEPEDIANAVMFLASEASSYVTGQVIKVDGGLTLGGMSAS